MEIHTWQDISKEYIGGSLLLGNGASIAIDACFKYRSLFEAANEAGRITEDIQKLFDYSETEDFELVLSSLAHARYVNEALGIEEERTDEAYTGLRQALIDTIRDIHPTYEEIEDYFPVVTEFLKGFKTVFSLTYDLVLYWAMLKENEELGGARFKDCFLHQRFEHDWPYLRTPREPAENVTLVFYPHGNLALASDSLHGDEFKIAAAEAPLLEEIFDHWMSGQVTPLFVSEGTSKQKIRAISRSDYLGTVLNDVLPKITDNSFVIYGSSLSDNDDHIINQLVHTKIDRIAVSVHCDDEKEAQNYAEQTKQKISRIWEEAHREMPEVEFFDAQSKDCWI